MYGRMEEVEYCHRVLLWDKGLYMPLLFVLVKWNGRTAIYVSTDLEASLPRQLFSRRSNHQ